MELGPASRYSYAELAEIFNAGYEGYFTPFNLDEAAFRLMSTTVDDDLGASRVVLVDGAPAGICKLAVRGDRGWIGGIGVAAPYRGNGVGEALMRTVLDVERRGLREIWLEVLAERARDPALREARLRDRARARDLDPRRPCVQKHKVRPVATAAAHERIRAERTHREPWQREDGSVANYEDVEALESEHGAILFRRAGDRIWLLQGIAADEDAARDLLLALPEQAASLHWLNSPAGDPFNAAIGALGGTQQWRQHEMLLAL